MRKTLDYIKDPAEKQFVKTIIDDMQRANYQNRHFVTEFYNKDWMKSVIDQYVPKHAALTFSFFGGYEDAERQVLAISPYELEEDDYKVIALQIEVKTGIGKPLSHRDYLGAILGLGIERSMIGDIILNDRGAYVMVTETMADYIRGQLLGIGRYQKIEIYEIPFKDLEIDKPKMKEMSMTVSSLRMDAVAAAMFNLSRSECSKLIQGDKARRNGLGITTSDLLKEGDIITLRGYGKAKLKSVDGYTKKERLHIKIEKYI